MKNRQCQFFCAILLSLSMRGAAVVPLYIGCLLAQSTHWWHNYAMFFPCLWESVFEEVSNRSDILPGYELRLVCKDTEVGATHLVWKKITSTYVGFIKVRLHTKFDCSMNMVKRVLKIIY